MKKTYLSILTIVFALFTFPAIGGDVYQAAIDGTDCKNCKKQVVKSFAELQGVEEVKFLKRKKNKMHVVVVKTDGSAPITGDEVAAMLKETQHFELKKWEKQTPAS